MHYLIYKITNRLNNKIYVGAHKTDNKNDEYFGSGLLLKRSVEKHGKENFNKEILFECVTELDMWQKESEIVDEEFVSRNDTYNVKLGGYGGFDYINKNKLYHKHSNSVLIEMRKKGNDIKKMLWETDAEYRTEYSKKLSMSVKVWQSVNGNPFKNRKHSEETKEKIRKSRLGKVTGRNNPSYGKQWVTNGTENKLVKKENIPSGWKKGRV